MKFLELTDDNLVTCVVNLDHVVAITLTDVSGYGSLGVLFADGTLAGGFRVPGLRPDMAYDHERSDAIARFFDRLTTP
jgi:hypothetical protein